MTKFHTSCLIAGLLSTILVGSSAAALLGNGQPDPGFNGNAMQLWLRADSGVDNPGGLVGTWSDRSTHGRDAVADDDALKPTHIAGAQGERDVLNFIDNGERMRLPASLNSVFSGAFTVFMLVAPDVTDPNRDELWFGSIDSSGGGTNRLFHGTDGNGNPTGLNTLFKADGNNANTNIAPTPIVGGEFTLVSYVNENLGGLNSVYIDGAATPAVSTASVDNSDFANVVTTPCVGAACWQADGFAWPNSSNTLKGQFAEIVIYAGALAEADRQAVEQYLIAYPEPGSMVLLAAGCVTLVVRRRRRGSR